MTRDDQVDDDPRLPAASRALLDQVERLRAATSAIDALGTLTPEQLDAHDGPIADHIQGAATFIGLAADWYRELDKLVGRIRDKSPSRKRKR